MTARKCTVEGCEKRHQARGFCADHYQKNLDSFPGRAECSVEDCHRPMRAGGFCKLHYARLYHSRPFEGDRYYRLSDQDWQVTVKLNQIKAGAKRRNIEWQLSDLEASRLIVSNCHYCGLMPHPVVQTKKRGHVSGLTCAAVGLNGIDRVDSGRHYVADNCVSCCPRCNVGKGVMTLEEFERWLELVYSRRTEWNHERRKRDQADRAPAEAQVPSAKSAQ